MEHVIQTPESVIACDSNSLTLSLVWGQNKSLRKEIYYWWHKFSWITEQHAPSAPKGSSHRAGSLRRSAGGEGMPSKCGAPRRFCSPQRCSRPQETSRWSSPWQCWHWWPQASFFLSMAQFLLPSKWWEKESFLPAYRQMLSVKMLCEQSSVT